VAGVQSRIDNIDKLLIAGRVTAEKLKELQVEHKALTAFLGGSGAVSGRIDEINNLFRVALLDEDGSERLTAERQVLQGLLGVYRTFEAQAAHIGREPQRTQIMVLEQEILEWAVAGAGTLESERQRLEARLESPDLPDHKRTVDGMQYNALKAFMHGGSALADRIAHLRQLLISAGMTPEASQAVEDEMRLLGALLDVQRRAVGPGAPIAEVRPEIMVEIAPEIQPEIIVEVAPDLGSDDDE
jgi:hypothetical protein